MNKITIAVDSGKKGGISFFFNGKLDHVIDMPTKKILVKKEVRVFKHKNKNILIKSGDKKGQRQTIIKSQAKYKTEIDFKNIVKEIQSYKDNARLFVVQKLSKRNSYRNQS